MMLLLIVSFSVKAQFLPNECGTPSSPYDHLRNITPQNMRVLSGTRVLKMYLVIYHNDDGSNEAIPEDVLKKEIFFSDSIFSIGSICFTIVGIEHRNSTYYNRITDPNNRPNYTSEQTSGAFTVFLVDSIVGGVFGYVTNTPSTFMVTKRIGFGPRRTFIHEMGHALGLSHTFKGTANNPADQGCAELADASNGTTCGDFVADTPADPYIRCGNAISGCTFPYTSPDCKDANNQSYNPQMHNLMSYWPNYGCDRTVFTSGQYIRMQTTIDNNTSLSSYLAPDNRVVSNATVSSGFVKEAAVIQLTAGFTLLGGNYTVNGSAQAAYSAGKVALIPGFTAAPGVGGVVRVMASYCQ